MKEAMKSIEEKGTKPSKLKEWYDRSIKFPTDEPCFPIRVNVVTPCVENVKSMK
jgi:hypothetical protein